MSKPNTKVSQVETNYVEELKKFQTKSERIRYLNAQGISRSEISKMLDIRYQFVRNVLERPLKKQANQ